MSIQDTYDLIHTQYECRDLMHHVVRLHQRVGRWDKDTDLRYERDHLQGELWAMKQRLARLCAELRD